MSILEYNTQASKKNAIYQHKELLSRFSNNEKLVDETPANTILYEDREIVVTPTLGSLVDQWIIVWPKRYFRNLHECVGSIAAIQQLGAKVASKFSIEFDDCIWFEHGAGCALGDVGCGLNFSHLHIIHHPNFSFSDFKSAVIENSMDRWVSNDLGASGAEINSGADYHVYGNSNKIECLANSTYLGSQFFRRVISTLVAPKTAWRYQDVDGTPRERATVKDFSLS